LEVNEKETRLQALAAGFSEQSVLIHSTEIFRELSVYGERNFTEQ